MPTYRVEVYELHSQKYEIEAESMADAVIGVHNGDGLIIDNSVEYIGVADKYAAPLDIGITIGDANKLSEYGFDLNSNASGIYGIRNVKEC